jgi:hypothetical protein
MEFQEVEFGRLAIGVYFAKDGEWYRKVAPRAAVRCSDGVLILDGSFSLHGVPKQLPEYKVLICRDSLRKNPREVQYA